MHSRLGNPGYKNDYPGPGSYLKFSEFGILVPKKKGKKNCGGKSSRNSVKSFTHSRFKTEGNIN